MKRRRVEPKMVWRTEAELCAAFISAQAEHCRAYPESAGWDILMVLPDVGPDYRAVLVPEADSGLQRLCNLLGLVCVTPNVRWNWHTNTHYPVQFEPLPLALVNAFDWHPEKRHDVPEFATDSVAGSPAPVTLTPWKLSALRVLALLDLQGQLTRKDIAQCGCDSRRWTQYWLQPGAERGTWIRNPQTPKFDQQHPTAYAELRARMQPKRAA